MAKYLPLALMMMLLLRSLNMGHGYTVLATCNPSSYLTGRGGGCNRQHDAECCVSGKKYPQYRCSPPPITGGSYNAHMTINSFEEGGDGGGRSECDERYHSDQEMVVALSTGWYSGGSRCHKNIRINANRRSVLAKVVDECDSVSGCDPEHDNQPPCSSNIVDASPAVWKALGITGSRVGGFPITWSEA